MRTPGLLLVALALAVFGLANTSIAGEPTFKVIVHPENPVDHIDRDFLRSAYLKKATAWRSGDTIRPVDLPARTTVRERFTHDVLRKTPAQLKTYWSQQIFSGKGVPPPEGATVQEVTAYVLANKGAIGYLPADADPGKAKVIGIR